MNAGEGAWFGRHDHPLLIDLILEKVFEYVRRRDLLVCRGVCKKWNELTIPFTRSKFTIGIQLSKEFLNHPRNPGEKSTRGIEDFLALFSKNTLGNPFGKFDLGPLCTRGGIGQQFLKLCGDTTTELRLCQDEQGDEFFKVEDVSELLRSMKKLEKLTMSAKLVTDSGNVVELFPGSKPKLSCLKMFILERDNLKGLDESCPTLLEELITAAENVSDLSMEEYWYSTVEGGHDRSNGLRALTVIERLDRESSIQSLTLQGVRMRPDVELLRKMTGKSNGLKLKELTFGMDGGVKESDHFHVIELFKDTLEHLKMNSRYSSFMNFPKMLKLTRLSLKISPPVFDTSLFNLNKIFPVLKELELHQYGRVFYDEFFPQSEPCPAMKSLRLLNGPRFRINGFNQVLTIFPRLTELQIMVGVGGAEVLREIWSRMTQLESLSIHGWVPYVESMDSLFTGITAEGIQGITDVVKGLDKLTVQCRKDTILNLRNQHCNFPSIGNLTKLRRLELKVSGWRSGYLSDVTGFLVFYSLNHLRRLFVHECELTKTCCQILTTEMEVGLESWAFTTPGGEAIIPDPTYDN